MVFNGSVVGAVIGIGIIIWLSIVSFFLLRMIRHYNTLTKDISSHGLKAILEQILKRQHTLVEKTGQLQELVNNVIVDGNSHFQKIGLVRFNPFSDTGGSQSFTMAILDKSDSGIVMTSLYARTGNRWYVKEITGGKAKGVDLSREEASAIQTAKEYGKHE